MTSNQQDRRSLGLRSGAREAWVWTLLTDLFLEKVKIRTPARAAQGAKEAGTEGQRLGLGPGPQEGPANGSASPGTAVTSSMQAAPILG